MNKRLKIGSTIDMNTEQKYKILLEFVRELLWKHSRIPCRWRPWAYRVLREIGEE